MGIGMVVVLDTETTGVDPATDSLLEIAWVPVRHSLPDDGAAWVVEGEGGPASWMIEYAGEIPPEARAVHHIAPADVRPGAPNVLPRSSVVHDMLCAEVEGEQVYAAHNAAFDSAFLPELARPWICTYRCALHMWPEAPSHKNQVLRYWLGVEPDDRLLEGLAPHRAMYDAAVTAAILQRMLGEYTAEQLLDMTGRPVLLTTCRFGKHKGERWEDVPRDYLSWMRRSGNWAGDMDVSYTLEHYL